MILYPPRSSVRIERDFSINTGLLASTDTPGRTAPLWSLTIPVKVLCALPSGASAVKQRNSRRTPATIGIFVDFLIVPPSQRNRQTLRTESVFPPPHAPFIEFLQDLTDAII